MLEESIQALAWYIQRNNPLISDSDNILIIRGMYHSVWELMREKKLISYQPYYPFAKEFTDNKIGISKELEGKYELIICFGTKHKAETLWNIGKSFELLQDDGTFVFVMSNKIGAKSFRQHIFPLFDPIQDLSKNRCKIYVTQKSVEPDTSLLEAYLAKGNWNRIEKSPFYTLPGVFSWQKIDVGSKLLLENLPQTLEGQGADLGSGYGFLTYNALKRFPDIEQIHLYEAEYLSIKSSMHNLSALPQAEGRYTLNWADVTREVKHNGLDWILMNPPFHAGKDADISIGHSFIKASAQMLRTGGTLYIVANRHLPYEKTLNEKFSKVEKLAEARGFKVYKGSL